MQSEENTLQCCCRLNSTPMCLQSVDCPKMVSSSGRVMFITSSPPSFVLLLLVALPKLIVDICEETATLFFLFNGARNTSSQTRRTITVHIFSRQFRIYFLFGCAHIQFDLTLSFIWINCALG